MIFLPGLLSCLHLQAYVRKALLGQRDSPALTPGGFAPLSVKGVAVSQPYLELPVEDGTVDFTHVQVGGGGGRRAAG